MADCVKFFNRGVGDLAVLKAIAISKPDTKWIPDKRTRMTSWLFCKDLYELDLDIIIKFMVAWHELCLV